jgi:hypothetical protein
MDRFLQNCSCIPIEAMNTFPTARILWVVREFDEKGDVFASIQDTGPGIEAGLLERCTGAR